jgi:hypothetical protein
MRRRTLLVALAGLAVVVAAGTVVLWPREDRVTRANYDRIQIGMSRVDVEAILGPPGDYRTGLGESDFGDDSASRWVGDPPGFPSSWGLGWFAYPNSLPVEGVPTASVQTNWFGDSCRICVEVDDAGRVRDSSVHNRRLTQGPLDNLLWRAKRQWHRWFP